jgi:hypothetical protein
MQNSRIITDVLNVDKAVKKGLAIIKLTLVTNQRIFELIR